MAHTPRARAAKTSVPSAVSAETKARILEGAAVAFGRLGYSNVRVEDVIEAAGVSRPTFYKVYSSKDDVLAALSTRHHREIRRRIQQAVATSNDPATQLAAMIDAFMRWRAGLGPVGRVLDLEARTPGSCIAHHRRATLRSMTKLSAEQLATAGRPAIDPVMITALISAMESVADSLLLEPNVDEATLQRANHVALRLVGAALAGPEDPTVPIPGPPEAKPSRGKTA